MSPSLNFDRIAHRYDATRGGDGRGERVAEPLVERLDASQLVLEIGIGTGLIAQALVKRGVRVLGVDLSMQMLLRARERLGPVVVRGDALRLPFRDDALRQAMAVWALHVTGDVGGVLREAARVLVRGGVLVVINSPDSAPAGDPFGESLARMEAALDPSGTRNDRVDRLATLGAEVGLRLEESTPLPGVLFATTRKVLESLRTRSYSTLWDVEDGAWTAHVEPVIRSLSALPESDLDVSYPLDAQLVVLRKD